MYDRISLSENINVNYMWAKSSPSLSVSPLDLNKPIWDTETIALARFNSEASASSFEGADMNYDSYKIYRRDKNSNVLKYIATIDTGVQKITDYTNFSNNECKYLIYPLSSDNSMGAVIETNTTPIKYGYWTITGTVQTDKKNIYIADVNNIWNFYLSPKVNSITQVTQKSNAVGFNRYPKIKHSDVNYSSGTLSFLLGDLSCPEDEYIDDSVDKKNRWNVFTNTPTPKVLTDPKGECMIVDITPLDYNVDFTLLQTPTTIRFEFTEIANADNISVYNEGAE